MSTVPSGAGPAGNPPLDAGTWIATLRVRQGLTRRELAARAGVRYGLLTKVEAGVELAPPAVLAACAGALGVGPGLLAGPYLPVNDDDLEVAAAERIRAGQDVLALPPGEAAVARPLPELADELRQARGWMRAARYDEAAAVLPRLVGDLRLAVLTLTGDDKQTALRLLDDAKTLGSQAVAGFTLARTAVAVSDLLAAGRLPHQRLSAAVSSPPRPAPAALMPSRIAVLACVALGSLAGFGLARLYFSGSLTLLILGGCLGVAVAWFLRWLRAVNGPGDPDTLLALYGSFGFQGAIVIWAVTTSHGVWLWVTAAWVLSWCMNAAGGRHPFGRAALYGYLVIVTGILLYRLAYLQLSWWYVPAWAAVAVVLGYLFPRLPRPARKFPAPGTGAVASVLYALHLPWWVVVLGAALCGVVYLLPGLSLSPGFPGDFDDVFPPVTLHS